MFKEKFYTVAKKPWRLVFLYLGSSYCKLGRNCQSLSERDYTVVFYRLFSNLLFQRPCCLNFYIACRLKASVWVMK